MLTAEGAIANEWKAENFDNISSVDWDDLSSARTLFNAARGSYERGDVQAAKLYFGLSEKLFIKAHETTNAYIARDWFNSLSEKAESFA